MFICIYFCAERSAIGRTRLRRSIVNKFLERLRKLMDTAMHLEIGRGISEYTREKWNDFSVNRKSFAKFVESSHAQ